MLMCSIDNCGRRVHARGLCGMHYQRLRVTGSVEPRRRPSLDEAFWAKVNKTDSCWVYQGAVTASGYGVVCLPKPSPLLTAHRYSAMLHFGMFDRRLNVLHHCDNRRCVNPDHLYLGTNIDNVRDMVERRRHWAHAMTSCKQGHDYTPENTRMYGSYRICRECERQGRRRRYLLTRQEANA